jgi:hypothetical protein
MFEGPGVKAHPVGLYEYMYMYLTDMDAQGACSNWRSPESPNDPLDARSITAFPNAAIISSVAYSIQQNLYRSLTATEIHTSCLPAYEPENAKSQNKGYVYGKTAPLHRNNP